MIKNSLIIIIAAISVQLIEAQDRSSELGSANIDRGSYARGFFDYSDPGSINIRISVWGFVKYPGKYLVPEYTTITDLLSFAGGPIEDANLDDIRLYRTFEDGREQMIKINYNDLMWEDKLNANYKRSVPSIQPRDILVVPGEPRLFFRDYFSLGVSVFVALVSVANLIVNLSRK